MATVCPARRTMPLTGRGGPLNRPTPARRFGAASAGSMALSNHKK